MHRIHDECGADRSDGPSRDQMEVLRTAEEIEELIGRGPGIDEDDGLLVGTHQRCDFVEIVDDDPSFEPIDHAVAEADGDDGCPDRGGRARQLGGHGGKRALHPLGSER